MNYAKMRIVRQQINQLGIGGKSGKVNGIGINQRADGRDPLRFRHLQFFSGAK
jgi:hypothetical protein